MEHITTTQEGTMIHLDEISNDELCTISMNEPQFTTELSRVESLITSLVMTGTDLTHWLSRSQILRQRLGK
jgi:hypothetical protein